MQGQSVVLGGLPLMVDGHDYQSVDGYTLTVTGEETSLGAAQSVTSVLLSMLTNGSVVSYDRDDNRAPVLIVEVSAAYDDGLALAKGEAALREVCKKRVELLWTPPQTGAPTAVFDIVHSTIQPLYSDVDEINMVRAYRIDMQALPYARSLEETVFPALPDGGSPALVTVNNADSTAGWAATDLGGGWVPDVLTDVGSAVRFTEGYTSDVGAPAEWIVGELTFPTGTLVGTPFLVVEYRTSRPPTAGLGSYNGWGTNVVNGNTVADVAIDSEWRRAWIRVTNDLSVLNKFVFRVVFNLFVWSPGEWLEIRDVSASAAPPALGTRKQLIQSFDIGGTETTQGSLTIDTGTSSPGDVIVYTRPDDGTPYVPPISGWITNSVSYATADTACVSGYKWNIVSAGGVLTYAIPAVAVPPGDYHVVVRIQRTNGSQPIPLKLGAETTLGLVGYGLQTRLITVQGGDDVWVIRNLGTLTLPGARVGPSGEVNVWIERTDVGEASGSILIDEVWLFKADGALTIVEGLVQPLLKIVAPSLEEPTGALWATADDTMAQSVMVSSLALSRQHHELDPGSNMAFTVTTVAPDSIVSATAFKRWNTFPAE